MGTKDDPRDQMASCDKKAANFNGSETGLPLWATAALLTAVASALVAVFIVVVCAGLLLAQLSMAIAAVLGVFVVPLGVIPGFGRALLARWAGTVLAAAAAVVGAMAFWPVADGGRRALTVRRGSFREVPSLSGRQGALTRASDSSIRRVSGRLSAAHLSVTGTGAFRLVAGASGLTGSSDYLVNIHYRNYAT